MKGKGVKERMKNRILNFMKINKKTGERKDGGYMKLIVNDDNRAGLEMVTG